MMNREQIAQEALSLPREDRTYLADVLEQSLTHGDFVTDKIAAEWTAEIHRRIAAFDRGESSGTDAREALDRIRSRLAAHRAGRSAP